MGVASLPEVIQLASNKPDVDRAGWGLRPADALAGGEVSSVSPS